MSDLVTVFVLSFWLVVNPTLLAAVTVMLLTPKPKRLMVGYLLGAYLVTIGLGMAFVFALHGSGTQSTSRNKVSPIEDLVVGVLALAIAWVLRTGRDRRFQERRRAKKEAKLQAKREAGKPTESLPLRLLGKADPRITFLVGAALSFPGVSYLDALDHIVKANPGTAGKVLLVLYVCVMQQLLLEVPLIAYAFAPERTQESVTRFRDWMGRRGRTAAVIGALVIGLYLVIRGLVNLL